ncbi:MAG: ABC transporter ATP-binding protein [Candidatus Loosdrechtia sp.]|uniref:ABC transporter ATP-binding protein n=1 Tax=Candidatus Loosdrechtia sp. TaxID=3101272 RepID=UPI003A608C94|nr:MAG: ABC transporter ATP-binding protein [Candidatus Jettenia sp. AMX2]
MQDKNRAIKVENISKCYRIGLKENMHDSVAKSILSFIVSPLKNYRKYRSLYRFNDLNNGNGNPDIIWALKNISFEVGQGEIVGIIGLNGAGKSTLLKILSRITEPTGGRAEIRGRISSLLEVGTGFHPELTGRENVYLNGTILGMRKKELDRKFDEIVDFSGIEKLIDTPIKRYSSGMKVRLAFAVAAHIEPEVLLIDEVLAVGDIQFQKKCLNKMEDIGKHGRTILFVSHNMAAVTRICPRSILLGNGGVLHDGPSHEVVSHYMGAEKGTRAERVWQPEEAPGDEVVRLYSVRILSEKSHVSEAVDIQQPVTIEMEYEVFRHGFVMFSYFRLINEEGIELFISFENDPEWRNRPRLPGRYVTHAQIPGNLLAEGVFYVTPTLRTLNPEIRRFKVPDAIAFQVVDSIDNNLARGDYYGGDFGGVIRPPVKWKTQYHSERAKSVLTVSSQ